MSLELFLRRLAYVDAQPYSQGLLVATHNVYRHYGAPVIGDLPELARAAADGVVVLQDKTDGVARVRPYRNPSVERVLDSMGFDQRAVNELAAYVIVTGRPDSKFYQYADPWSDEIVHVLLCGVVWGKSEGPTDDTWGTFTSTEEPPDEHAVIEVRLSCQCGKKRPVRIGIDRPSIAELFTLLRDGVEGVI